MPFEPREALNGIWIVLERDEKCIEHGRGVVGELGVGEWGRLLVVCIGLHGKAKVISRVV